MDDRLEGNITPKKRLEIGCKTCSSNEKVCQEDDPCVLEDFGFKSEYEWCKNKGFHLWSPHYKYTPIFCKGCKMYGLLGGYTNTNEFDYPWYKCCRHAEPCWRNPNHDNVEVIYFERDGDLKV